MKQINILALAAALLGASAERFFGRGPAMLDMRDRKFIGRGDYREPTRSRYRQPRSYGIQWNAMASYRTRYESATPALNSRGKQFCKRFCDKSRAFCYR
jgi:hypothetical protein